MAKDLEAACKELTRRVMGRPGVTGTAVGERGGKPCLKVYVSDREAGRSIPKDVGGYPVVVETTGSFRRL
ncbi:MAG: hypothetical protein AB7T31_01845 [Gemmatimonadales bacterium]